MKYNNILIILSLFMVTGMAAVLIIQNTVAHEEIHKTIALNYGAISADIHYSLFDSYTQIVSNSTDETENELQVLNEIIGYNTTTIMLGIIALMYVIELLIILFILKD